MVAVKVPFCKSVRVTEPVKSPPRVIVGLRLMTPDTVRFATVVLPEDRVFDIVTAPLTTSVLLRLVAPPTLAVPETLAKPVTDKLAVEVFPEETVLRIPLNYI